MKVKELIKKYPNYQVIEMGYPDSIPFTMLPKELQGLSGKAYEKVEMELEVKGYKVYHKPVICVDITHCVFGGKKKPNAKYEGTLYIYLKSNKPYFKKGR